MATLNEETSSTPSTRTSAPGKTIPAAEIDASRLDFMLVTPIATSTTWEAANKTQTLIHSTSDILMIICTTPHFTLPSILSHPIDYFYLCTFLAPDGKHAIANANLATGDHIVAQPSHLLFRTWSWMRPQRRPDMTMWLRLSSNGSPWRPRLNTPEKGIMMQNGCRTRQECASAYYAVVSLPLSFIWEENSVV